MNDGVLLQMKGISKYFPGVRALNNVSFTLNRGEIHGLIGENGAGKSTLINILGGVFPADAGQIYIHGQEVHLNSVRDSQQSGVAIIHQELVLVPHMTIAENIFLGREPKTSMGTVDYSYMYKRATDIIQKIGMQINAKKMVEELSVAQQQMVEIAKALSLKAKILVMDEPTSSLTDAEVAVLFKTISSLKSQGVGIIYVSHRMAELFAITDRITVLRDGEYIDTVSTDKTDIDRLVYLMVGRELENYYTRHPQNPGETALRVSNLNKRGVLKDISFEVREREIVGFAGLIGAGRSELMQTLVGLEDFDSGEIWLYSEKLEKFNCKSMRDRGLVMVPENRKQQGLFLQNSVMFNISINSLEQFIKWFQVHKNKEKSIAAEAIRKLGIKTPSFDQITVNLSGGNQQKVLIGKWLATAPRILILDEPTRGVDVGAKADIYAFIDNMTASGMAVIIVSSELNELINMCDRVYVMANGQITGSLKSSEFDQERIMQYATGMTNN